MFVHLQKIALTRIVIIALLTAALFSACTKEILVQPPPSLSYFESFDSLSKVLAKGWITVNNSRPVGIRSWAAGYFTTNQFGFDGFPAHSYFASAQEYISVNYNSGSDVSNLSDWLISPVLNIKDGDSLTFFTRTVGPVAYPDRLQVWANYTSESADVGNQYNSTGEFKTLLVDINPLLTPSGFPASWTQYGLLVKNGSPTPIKGRFAFRYFVDDGGPAGNNSNLVGIDDFYFVSK